MNVPRRYPNPFLGKAKAKILTGCKSSDAVKSHPIEPVVLSYASYETNDTSTVPPVIVTHGLLGSKRQWKTICKNILGKTSPKRKVLAVDARNHGDSPWSQTNTLDDMVSDLKFFLKGKTIKTFAGLGHSMGGLTMMLFSLRYISLIAQPEMVERLMVADVSPKVYRDHRELLEIFTSLEGVSVPSNVPNSVAVSIADQQLAKTFKNKSVRMFLLTNLVQKSDGRYAWRVNTAVLKNSLPDILGFPDVGPLKYEKPALFLTGEKSNYVKESDHPKILQLFPSAQFYSVKNGTHWLHSDNPADFSKTCADFLNSASTRDP